MSETALTCQIHKKYKEEYKKIDCTHPGLPGDPDGLCILHSQDPAKDPYAFMDAILAIWNRKYSKSHDFFGVFFPGPFDPLKFFGSCELSKPVAFSGATFMQEANFFEATFTQEAVFYQVTFTKRAIFSGATIAGRVLFRHLNPQEGDEPPPPFIGDFRALKFQDKGLLRFQDMSLAQVRFAGTDMRRPEFHHVTWNDHRRRQAIYEEILLRQEEKKDPWFWKWFRSSFCRWLACYCPYIRPPETPWGDKYGKVERLYRDLQINYESVNDYKTSGDFHYGEMEMYRRASKWRWFPFYWYNLYWVLSGYGERPSQALGWLAVLLLLLPLLIWLLGLDISPQGSGFWDTFSYMFEKATFQKTEPKLKINALGWLISNLGLLLIPGQAALFFLALRNRLGRRR